MPRNEWLTLFFTAVSAVTAVPADWGFRGGVRVGSVAGMISRAGARWAAVAGACVTFACSDGTSRWILEETAPAVVEQDAATTDAGPALEGDAGEGMAGEDGGSADAGVPLPDPEPFATACAPQITVDNRTADGRGALFDEALPLPGESMLEIGKQVCALLYQTPDEVPATPPIVLVVEDFYGIGEVGISGPVIYMRLSSLHMQSVAEAGQSVRDDVTGSLHYLLAIYFELRDENPGAVRWVTEGIAFWVRYRAGYASLAQRTAGGDPRRDDYKVAGFFFDWLERTHPGALYLLNQRLDPDDGEPWSERAFEQITGKDLPTLWNEYQATL
jgi:hypothetical protein